MQPAGYSTPKSQRGLVRTPKKPLRLRQLCQVVWQSLRTLGMSALEMLNPCHPEDCTNVSASYVEEKEAEMIWMPESLRHQKLKLHLVQHLQHHLRHWKPGKQ